MRTIPRYSTDYVNTVILLSPRPRESFESYSENCRGIINHISSYGRTNCYPVLLHRDNKITSTIWWTHHTDHLYS